MQNIKNQHIFNGRTDFLVRPLDNSNMPKLTKITLQADGRTYPNYFFALTSAFIILKKNKKTSN